MLYYKDNEVKTEEELGQEFDAWIDEEEELVVVLGLEYDTSKVLKAIDPIYYKAAFNEWVDYMGWDES